MEPSAQAGGTSQPSSGTSGGLGLSLIEDYTEEERALIAESQAPDGDGNQRRAFVRDINGRLCTLAGMNRWNGDFTMRAGYPLSKVAELGPQAHWIREPDFDDPPGTVDRGYAHVEGRAILVHSNSRPARRHDTVGMFPEGMTLVVDSRTPEELREEAESASASKPGVYGDLEDDIRLGESPREHTRRLCGDR